MNKIFQAWGLGALMALSVISLSAQAQTTPTAEQLIEQLKHPPMAKTRSLRGTRNLGVSASGEAPADTAQIEKPSVSLLIQFDFDSSRIKPESRQSLLNLVKALNANELAQNNFMIEGHTDGKGAADYNLKLSELRAEKVREFLTQQGVGHARLSALGKGSSELANSNDPLAAENRRVRIVNLN